MSLFTRNPHASVGLDIDGAYLAAATVDDGSIGRMASVELERGITLDGEVTDPDGLAAVLKDMFSRFDLPKQVRLGVANQQIVVRQLELPLIQDEAERDAAVRFQAAEAIPMPLDEVVMDYAVTGAKETPDGAVRERILVVAARTSMITTLVEAVKKAGLKPVGVDLNAFALVRMLGEQGPEAAQDPDHPGRVLCHLGGVTNLAIAVGSVCVFTRALQSVRDGEESSSESIAEEIRLSIDFYRAGPDARPLGSVVLSGPGAEDPALVEAIQNRTGLETSVGAPLGAMGTHTVPSLDDPYRYTVAAGLALGAT